MRAQTKGGITHTVSHRGQSAQGERTAERPHRRGGNIGRPHGPGLARLTLGPGNGHSEKTRLLNMEAENAVSSKLMDDHEVFAGERHS